MHACSLVQPVSLQLGRCVATYEPLDRADSMEKAVTAFRTSVVLRRETLRETASRWCPATT
jgi:hypothetical protein